MISFDKSRNVSQLTITKDET